MTTGCGADSVDQWTTVIGTAMHFNEMLFSSRSLLASVMLALAGAAAFSLVHLKSKEAFVGRIHVGIMILIGGALLLICVFLIDYFYYFRLLLGSVDTAQSLEQQCPELARFTIELSERVSRAWSHIVIILFYGTIFLGLIVLGFVIFFYSKSSSSGRPTRSTRNRK
jgi:hypothetical protein